MANIDNFQSIYNDPNQRDKKSAAKVLILTTVDDNDDGKFLLSFTPNDAGTIVVNLSHNNMIDTSTFNNNRNKRSLPQLENEHTKRPKGDLTCVICEGNASGYNFSQISCESCKAFFRRNGLHAIEKTKCRNPKISSNRIRCNIRYDVKYKCQRCRLLKCLESGMRKDFILTPEEKLSKQQRLEENRRIRSTQFNNNLDEIKSESIEEHPSIYTKFEPIVGMPSSPSFVFTEDDWSCLHYIQNAYLSALQSSPSASSVISFELTSDKMSAYMNTLDVQNFAAVKLIYFIKQIPEFEELNENDRLMLVEYNLPLLFIMSRALSFDATREICYDDDLSSSVSSAGEAFAQHCKSLFILCYGYEFSRRFLSVLHTITGLIDKDSIIVQLLMVNMIFLKGLSANDDAEPSLNDNQHVFQAHSKYTDLLFRYLIKQSSFNVAVIKMMRITEVFIRIQRITRDFHQYMKSKIDVNYVNPLMKSLLHLT